MSDQPSQTGDIAALAKGVPVEAGTMESSKLASYVASRICHDIASPLTPLMQSCEMLFDDSMGAAMKAEGVLK